MNSILHKGLEDILLKRLPLCINKMKVMNNIYLDNKSCFELKELESSFPNKGKSKVQLEELIGEEAFYQFTVDYLERRLSIQNNYESKANTIELNKIPSFEDANNLSKEIINSFKALPNTYLISFNLGTEIRSRLSDLFSIELNKTINVDKIDENFIEHYPLEGEYSFSRQRSSGLLMNFPLTLTWKKEAAYLQMTFQGYITKYFDSPIIERAISNIKSFYGLGIALNLFQVKSRVIPNLEPIDLIIHKQINDVWEFDGSRSLSTEMIKTIDDICINKNLDDIPIEYQKQLFTLDINNIKFAFSNQNRCEKILLASIWLFDSYCSENNLLSFVQTMIAIEILLGEKEMSDLIGIGELLRNRCAYLIGESHFDRLNIIQDLKNIYETRSKIVHRGKSKLNNSEQIQFYKLREMCKKIIRKELQLITNDTSRTTEVRRN